MLTSLQQPPLDSSLLSPWLWVGTSSWNIELVLFLKQKTFQSAGTLVESFQGHIPLQVLSKCNWLTIEENVPKRWVCPRSITQGKKSSRSKYDVGGLSPHSITNSPSPAGCLTTRLSSESNRFQQAEGSVPRQPSTSDANCKSRLSPVLLIVWL